MSLLDSLFLDPAPFDVWVAIRTDGIKGSGTLNDPYDGSTQSKFDSLMSGYAANTRVHLGPGTFTTQGYYDGAASGYGWQPKPAMKIIGSGIDVTTIQLASSLPTNNVHYFAIGHALSTGTAPNQVANPMDFCEVSDLTIDSNLAGQGSNTVACGAVRLFGSHVRVRRVKAKNWGNKLPSNLPSNLGFVLAVVVADPDTNAAMIDAGIEDCLALTPATNTSRDVLILHAGGKDYDATNQLEAYGTGPFIRNCFVDCDSTGSLGANVSTDYHRFFRGLSMSSCKGGVIEGNQVHNTWYGGPYLTKWSARGIVARNNFYKNVVTGPFLNLPAPGSMTNVTLFTLPNSSPDTTVEATATNHPLAAGDRVKISQGTDPLLNGVFVVTALTSANTFQYKASARPNPAGTGKMQKVLGVEKVVVEANVVELATLPSGQTPAWPTPVGVQLAADPSAAAALAYVYGDVIIRENKIRYVDGLFDPSFLGYPLNVQGARNLIVRENVLESAPPGVAPLQNSLCGSVSYFNDETPAGVLVQGVQTDATPNKKYAELATNAEDAFVLAFLNKR